MTSQGIRKGNLGILVGGGPAPGINSVIAAATIRARLAGVQVIGIQDGFRNLMTGELLHVDGVRARNLDIRDVSRVHFRGGSFLGISRANPTVNPESSQKPPMEIVIDTLHRLGITMLITIGGDDTAYSAAELSNATGEGVHVVHVPKTIDNDLKLPGLVDTFGYQTARHVGTQLVRDLMTDAETSTRWYFAIAMGRKAGHLALGIGKAAGATVTIIPEEFTQKDKDGNDTKVEFDDIINTLVGAIIKRRASDRGHGVVVIAEGVLLNLNPKTIPKAAKKEIESAGFDAHGHLRLANIDIGGLIRSGVYARFKQIPGFDPPSIQAKNVGYELRCVDPIPFDIEYTRDLGYCAAKHLLENGDRVVVALDRGHFTPMSFDDLYDPKTNRTAVRMVDTESARYAIARRYMVRIRRDDFDSTDPSKINMLERMARICGLSPDEFRAEFMPLTRFEKPPLDLERSACEGSEGDLLHGVQR